VQAGPIDYLAVLVQVQMLLWLLSTLLYLKIEFVCSNQHGSRS
jgi:hypothetical protein